MSSHDHEAASDTNPHLTGVVGRAETDLAMLGRLAEIGMRIAEEIGERAVNSPITPKPNTSLAAPSPTSRGRSG